MTKDVSTQTDHEKDDVHVEEEVDSDATIDYKYQDPDPGTCSSTSSGSYTDVYEADEDYDGPPYHSQPCMVGKHGASYTPPGWKRRSVKRKKLGYQYERHNDSSQN